jgi:hypothetical protein
VNLLITNSHAAQAYAILRALRPYAGRVVATMNGTTRWRALTSHAAHSRHIDACYYTPHSAVDWLAGVVQDTNTENEEAYVRRIEDICRAERIDTIFPSSDAEVYVFAKNKARFARQGIVCIVQDSGSLTGVNEPLLLLRLARGESIQPVTTFPRGALVFEPIEDLLDLPFELLDLMLYRIRINILGRQPTDRHNPSRPTTAHEVARSSAFTHVICSRIQRRVDSGSTRTRDYFCERSTAAANDS